MTFATLAQHCKETRYCEAFYDEQGRKLYGVREPKKFASMINRLVSSLGHLKLTDITIQHAQPCGPLAGTGCNCEPRLGQEFLAD